MSENINRGNNSQQKISIRFFNDREIRAIWDAEHGKWMLSVQNVISAIRNEDSYEKTATTGSI